jgi:hypothetical protein
LKPVTSGPTASTVPATSVEIGCVQRGRFYLYQDLIVGRLRRVQIDQGKDGG